MAATSTLRRLLRDTHGVAFVEFAFVAPVLLILILGGLEVANYAIAHLRTSQIAVTVADNAGRVATGIDEGDIYEVFSGADSIGASMKFEEHGRVVLSSLEHNGETGGAAGQVINWQRCWGELAQESVYGEEGDGQHDDSLADGMGAGDGITSAAGTAVMFVEVTYTYQPLLDAGFFDAPQIRYESAFNVRGRQNNNITNAHQLTVLDCD